MRRGQQAGILSCCFCCSWHTVCLCGQIIPKICWQIFPHLDCRLPISHWKISVGKWNFFPPPEESLYSWIIFMNGEKISAFADRRKFIQWTYNFPCTIQNTKIGWEGSKSFFVGVGAANILNLSIWAKFLYLIVKLYVAKNSCLCRGEIKWSKGNGPVKFKAVGNEPHSPT